MLFSRYEEYLFIGFIGLFSEDGFYLTQAGRVVYKRYLDNNYNLVIFQHSNLIRAITRKKMN
jgi:hypothetical protein